VSIIVGLFGVNSHFLIFCVIWTLSANAEIARSFYVDSAPKIREKRNEANGAGHTNSNINCLITTYTSSSISCFSLIHTMMN
jgi:hypothetical protein